ncbi:hypothetical protein D3C86_1375040 [compost metagenome]
MSGVGAPTVAALGSRSVGAPIPHLLLYLVTAARHSPCLTAEKEESEQEHNPRPTDQRTAQAGVSFTWRSCFDIEAGIFPGFPCLNRRLRLR